MIAKYSFKITEKNALLIYSAFASIIGLLSLIWLSNQWMSSVLVFFEALILIVLLVNKRFSSFFSLFILFTALSINSPVYAGKKDFYGWNTVKFFRIEIAAWMLVLFVIVSVLLKKSKVSNTNINFRKFTKIFIVICFLGVLVGLLTIAINDNNIMRVDNYWSQYIAIVYIMAAYPLLLTYTTYYCKTREPDSFYKLKASILGVFVGCSVQALYSFFSSLIINYGGVEGIGLSISNIYIYIPIALYYLFYPKNQNRSKLMPYLLVVSAGVLIVIFNNANGKILLFLLLAPLIWLALSQSKVRIAVLIAILSSILGIIILISSFDITQNYLLFKKINEVISLLNIFSDNWLGNISASPKFRISEFLNTGVEFLNKPFYIFTGKGYLGSIVDHLDMFYRVGGDFSDYQWHNGIFYFLHESLNLLLLNNGLLGVYLWIYSLRFTIRNYKKSFFILFGGIWFCMNYGFSIIITTVGMTAFLIGLLESSQVQNAD